MLKNNLCVPWCKGTNITNSVPTISTVKINEFSPESKIALKAINTFKRREEMERLGLGRGVSKIKRLFYCSNHQKEMISCKRTKFTTKCGMIKAVAFPP